MTSNKQKPAGLAKLLPIALIVLVALGAWLLDNNEATVSTAAEGSAAVASGDDNNDITQPSFQQSDDSQIGTEEQDDQGLSDDALPVELSEGSSSSSNEPTSNSGTDPPAASDTKTNSDTKTEKSTSPEDTADAGPSFRPVSDLPIIYSSELPGEAIDTLGLIANGGPYPFDQDDSVFQNREGVLPDHDRGYYHEYTVVTPGLSHRGAKRIVAGDGGELYYTNDHYDSFSEIGY